MDRVLGTDIVGGSGICLADVAEVASGAALVLPSSPGPAEVPMSSLAMAASAAQAVVKAEAHGADEGGGARPGGRVKVDASQATATPCATEELVAFATRWSLDEQSLKLVRDLPGDTQRKVLLMFKPRPKTQSVNAKLIGFVKAQVAQRRNVFGGTAAIGAAVTAASPVGSATAVGPGAQPVGAASPPPMPSAPPGLQPT
eukprot:CAMPEP_0180804844 /NCGR_PEP_ID=MMETSP1038_2-20121128/61683_1 /TAXON_ID=632150 /ORGANISM="Azadinium spinosum, Strain 3D9" /LENGTH=199 /DNA_ID=CAMNT_0022845325 /DNA_START=31 /DNA_END=627 /DNA_ORIENTATION=+